MRGNLFILSGPSGVGKTTLISFLIQLMPDLTRITTCTTRPPRPGEKDGLDYHFLSPEEFQKGVKANQFLEYALVHDNYYGTPLKDVEQTLSAGTNIYLIIDVQGASLIKEKMPSAISIFIKPDSLKVLKERLSFRPGITATELKHRLTNAKKELAHSKNYDYIVINKQGKVRETAQKIAQIMQKHGKVDK